MLALGGAFEAIDELKGRLVRVDGRAHAPHRVRRPGRRRRQPLHRDRAVAARRRRVASSRSTRRSRPRLSPTSQAWRADRDDDAVEARARRAAAGGRVRRERHAGHRSPWPTPAAPPASGRGVLREVFGEYRGPDRRRRRPSAGAAASWPRSPSACKAIAGGPPRLLVAKPGLDGHSQRRRADRRRRPRRRHGGRLPGHPPHARADRGRRPATRTPTSSACRSCPAPPRAGARRGRACCASRASTPRSSSAASSPRTTGRGCSPPASPPSTRPKDFELARIMGEIADLAVAHRGG